MDLRYEVKFSKKGTNLMYTTKKSGEVRSFLLGGYDQMFQDADLTSNRRVLQMISEQTVEYNNENVLDD